MSLRRMVCAILWGVDVCTEGWSAVLVSMSMSDLGCRAAVFHGWGKGVVAHVHLALCAPFQKCGAVLCSCGD